MLQLNTQYYLSMQTNLSPKRVISTQSPIISDLNSQDYKGTHKQISNMQIKQTVEQLQILLIAKIDQSVRILQDFRKQIQASKASSHFLTLKHDQLILSFFVKIKQQLNSDLIIINNYCEDIKKTVLPNAKYTNDPFIKKQIYFAVMSNVKDIIQIKQNMNYKRQTVKSQKKPQLSIQDIHQNIRYLGQQKNQNLFQPQSKIVQLVNRVKKIINKLLNYQSLSKSLNHNQNFYMNKIITNQNFINLKRNLTSLISQEKIISNQNYIQSIEYFKNRIQIQAKQSIKIETAIKQYTIYGENPQLKLDAYSFIRSITQQLNSIKQNLGQVKQQIKNLQIKKFEKSQQQFDKTTVLNINDQDFQSQIESINEQTQKNEVFKQNQITDQNQSNDLVVNYLYIQSNLTQSNNNIRENEINQQMSSSVQHTNGTLIDNNCLRQIQKVSLLNLPKQNEINHQKKSNQQVADPHIIQKTLNQQGNNIQEQKNRQATMNQIGQQQLSKLSTIISQQTNSKQPQQVNLKYQQKNICHNYKCETQLKQITQLNLNQRKNIESKFESKWKNQNIPKQQESKKQNSQQNNRIQKLQDQVNRLTTENNKFMRQIIQALKKSNNLHQEITKLNNQNQLLNQFKTKYQFLKGVNQSNQSQIKDLKQKLKQQTQHHKTTKLSLANFNQIEQIIKDKTLQAETLTQNIKQIKSQLEQIKSQLENEKNTFQQTKANIAKQKNALTNLLTQNINLLCNLNAQSVQQTRYINPNKDQKLNHDKVSQKMNQLNAQYKQLESKFNKQLNESYETSNTLSQQFIRLNKLFKQFIDKKFKQIQIQQFKLKQLKLQTQNYIIQTKKTFENQYKYLIQLKQNISKSKLLQDEEKNKLEQLKIQYKQAISKNFKYIKEFSTIQQQKQDLQQRTLQINSLIQQFNINKQKYFTTQYQFIINKKNNLSADLKTIKANLFNKQKQLYQLSRNFKDLQLQNIQIQRDRQNQIKIQQQLKGQLVMAQRQKQRISKGQVNSLVNLFQSKRLSVQQINKNKVSIHTQKFVQEMQSKQSRSIQDIQKLYNSKFDLQNKNYNKLNDNINREKQQLNKKYEQSKKQLKSMLVTLNKVNYSLRRVQQKTFPQKKIQQVKNPEEVMTLLASVLNNYQQSIQISNSYAQQYNQTRQKIQSFIQSLSIKLNHQDKSLKRENVNELNKQFRMGKYLQQLRIQMLSLLTINKTDNLSHKLNHNESFIKNVKYFFAHFVAKLQMINKQDDQIWAQKIAKQYKLQISGKQQQFKILNDKIATAQNQKLKIKQQLTQSEKKYNQTQSNLQRHIQLNKSTNIKNINYQTQVKGLNAEVKKLNDNIKQLRQSNNILESQQTQKSILIKKLNNKIQQKGQILRLKQQQKQNLLNKKDTQLEVISGVLIAQKQNKRKQKQELQNYYNKKLQQLNNNITLLKSQKQTLSEKSKLLASKLQQQKAINQSQQTIFTQLIQKLKLNIIKPSLNEISTAIEGFNPQVGMKIITSTILLGMDQARHNLVKAIEQFHGQNMERSDVLFRTSPKNISMLNLLPKGAFILLYKSKRNRLFGSYSKGLAQPTLIFSINPLNHTISTFSPQTIPQSIDSLNIQQTRYLTYGRGQMRLNMTDLSSISTNSHLVGQVYYHKIVWSQFTGEMDDKVGLAEIELHRVQWK